MKSNPAGPRYSDAAFVRVNSSVSTRGSLYTNTYVRGIVRSHNTPEGTPVRLHGMMSNGQYDIVGIHVGRRFTLWHGNHAIYSPIEGVFNDLNIHRVLRQGEIQ